MNAQLIKSPFEHTLRTLLAKTKHEIVVSSPYINESGVSIFSNAIPAKSDIKLSILTSLSLKNIVSNVTQPSALLKMVDAFRETQISSLDKLHAKVYVIDESYAIITSANLTYGGIKTNFEYGALVNDKKTVASVKSDILEYSGLGSSIGRSFLEEIELESKKIEKIKTGLAKKYKDSSLSKLLRKTERKISKSLLVNRVDGGSTINEIFSKSIIYLLSKYSQLTTAQLNSMIKEIHPEICDDRVDRIISGQHFGKLWKHAVRNAQSSLKKSGAINNSGKRGNQIWFIEHS